jgi:hypothetical protein
LARHYIPAKANSHEREEFSERLKHALTKEFNRRHSSKDISHQGVQKWLAGESIPTPDKLRTLSVWPGVSIAWLRDGEGKETAGLPAHDAATGSYRTNITEQELVRRYRKLNDRQQQAVAEIVTALAAKDSRR